MDWVTEMTFHKRLSMLLFAWTLAVAGVCSAQDTQPEHNPLFGTDYLVGHDDVLSIEVWNQPSLTGKFTVDADGFFKGQSFDPEDIHIVCPWHGYEFHLATGENVCNKRLRLKKYDVVERGGEVYVAI